MKLYSYIVTHDSGFSPNPFWNLLTLACCKPTIRSSIGSHYLKNKEEYWVVGLSPKSEGNKIIYAMKVTNVVNYKEYFDNFKNKIPDFNKNELIYQCGDNIYKPVKNGFEQLRSLHSYEHRSDDKWGLDLSNFVHDLSGIYVLVSDDYYYFGKEAKELPYNLGDLKIGRGCKCNFIDDKALHKNFIKYIQNENSFVRARPTIWSDNDDSWRRFYKP